MVKNRLTNNRFALIIAAVAWTKAAIRIIGGLSLFTFGLHIRSKVARLKAKRLSRFLTDDLLIPAFSTLAVFIFLALDPIRCWAEHPSNRSVCERTLIGQAGLGVIIVIHFGTTLVNSTFPEAVKDMHTISIHMIATGSLSLRKAVRMGGERVQGARRQPDNAVRSYRYKSHPLSQTSFASLIAVNVIALCCTFFLFAQYNARAGANDGEEAILFASGMLGAGLILIVGLWEWFVMSRERLSTSQERFPDPHPVLKLHTGFQALGFTISTTYAVLGWTQTMTMNTAFGSIQR